MAAEYFSEEAPILFRAVCGANSDGRTLGKFGLTVVFFAVNGKGLRIVVGMVGMKEVGLRVGFVAIEGIVHCTTKVRSVVGSGMLSVRGGVVRRQDVALMDLMTDDVALARDVWTIESRCDYEDEAGVLLLLIDRLKE